MRRSQVYLNSVVVLVLWFSFDAHPGRVKRLARQWACWHWRETLLWVEVQLMTWQSWLQCSSVDWQRDLSMLWPWGKPTSKVRDFFLSYFVTAGWSLLESANWFLSCLLFLYRRPDITQLQERRAHYNNQRWWVLSATWLDKRKKWAHRTNRSRPHWRYLNPANTQQTHQWGHGTEMSVTHPSKMSYCAHNLLSIKRVACFFLSEPPQLVSQPEEGHHTGKPERNRNSGEISSRHAEGILHGVLQVAGNYLYFATFCMFSPADQQEKALWNSSDSRKTPVLFPWSCRQPTKDVNRQVMSRNAAPERLWLNSREPIRQPFLKKLVGNSDLSHKACLAFTDILYAPELYQKVAFLTMFFCLFHQCTFWHGSKSHEFSIWVSISMEAQ